MREWAGRVRRTLVGLRGKESGQDLIEYALLAAIIALIAVAALSPVAKVFNASMSSVGSKLHKHVGKHLGWSK